MRDRRMILILLLLGLFFAACTGGEAVDSETADHSETASMAEEDGRMAGEPEQMADQQMEETADDKMEEGSPVTSSNIAWQDMTLTDVVSGESFTFADFAGKTVFVEPMATWCTNCRRQLGNVQEANAQLGDDVIFVGLSVETNISDDMLAEYSFNNGFDFKFAVLDSEVLQSLVDTFGTTVANPPATPHFIIRPDGSVTDLVTGFESAEELIQSIQAAQG